MTPPQGRKPVDVVCVTKKDLRQCERKAGQRVKRRAHIVYEDTEVLSLEVPMREASCLAHPS